MTTTTPTLADAEAALAKFDARIADLAERETEATKAFATDPSDANAKRAREARMFLDDWKRGRELAAANVEAARVATASSEKAEHAVRAKVLAERASRRGFRQALAPHAERLVQLRDEAERELEAIQRAIEEQRRSAAEASFHAAHADIECNVPRFTIADAIAVILPAMSAGKHHPVGSLFRQIDEESVLARTVLEAVGLAPVLDPEHMSYAEQIDGALNGDDIYAATRATAAE